MMLLNQDSHCKLVYSDHTIKIDLKNFVSKLIEETRGLVIKAGALFREVMCSIPCYGDYFSCPIHLDQSMDKNLLETLFWQCVVNLGWWILVFIGGY